MIAICGIGIAFYSQTKNPTYNTIDKILPNSIAKNKLFLTCRIRSIHIFIPMPFVILNLILQIQVEPTGHSII